MARVPEWLMVTFKVSSLYRHTYSLAEIGSLSVFEQQFTLMLFFITVPLRLSYAVAEGLRRSVSHQL